MQALAWEVHWSIAGRLASDLARDKEVPGHLTALRSGARSESKSKSTSTSVQVFECTSAKVQKCKSVKAEAKAKGRGSSQ